MKYIFILILTLVVMSHPSIADTIAVDGTNCTLGDAITVANTDATVGGCVDVAMGADILVLDVTYTATSADMVNSTLQYGANAALPDITTDITITEAVGQTVSIERNPSYTCSVANQADEFRLLQVLAGGHLTLDNVDIKNGCADSAGAVLVVDSELTSESMSFERNTARFLSGGGTITGGGAVAFYGLNSTGDFNNSTFDNNMSVANLDVFITGGAIKAELIDTISINASTFNNNSAIAEFVDVTVVHGGAIYINSGNSLSITNSVFDGNMVFGKSSGGALYLSMNLNQVIISSSQFNNNSAADIFTQAKGGAIYMENTTSTLMDLVFSQNMAMGDAAAIGIVDADGGALYSVSTDLTMNNIYFFSNGVLGSNTNTGGSASGGALFSGNNSGQFSNLTFVNNSSQGGAGSLSFGGSAKGGAISISSAITLSNITLSGNQAIGGNSISASGGSVEGGAYYGADQVTLSNITVSANSITVGIGSVSNGNANGAGIYIDDPHSIENSIIENNSINDNGLISPSNCFDGNAASTPYITSLGYNLVGDEGNCIFASLGDQTQSTASLIAIADNGCETSLPDGSCLPTQGIDINSNAIDQGSCIGSGLTTDARGYNRPYDGPNTSNADDGCDIGAFEYVDASVNPFALFSDGFE